MKVCFLTEMPFSGKVEATHPNMRTEFAWMQSLDADHHNIYSFNNVMGYDFIFIIFPKGEVTLGPSGGKLIEKENPISVLLNSNIIEILKKNNNKILYIQEGPHWWWTNYDLVDQILFYNMVSGCDAILAHNQSDTNYYRGLFPNKNIYVIPSLIIETLVSTITPTKEDKVIIGGNFCRWYGGFESYIIANKFNLPIWTQTSHAMRENENEVENLNHFPRLLWKDWMTELANFKYAVHMMPTVAAGTFSLNCAYFGIPCIGNEKVDTQRICFPDLSTDVADIDNANLLVYRLQNDLDFYRKCSNDAIKNYKSYYGIDSFKKNMEYIFNHCNIS